MCGIAGWVAPAASAPEERALQPMLDALLHRGPDGAGSHAFSAERGAYRGVLGHRRLAIIDPNGSRQPMCDADAGLALTFNGEIYNFRELRAELERHGHSFQRDSDTEVLLRAYQQWGTQCVQHLRGQFAFAVWDARAERLFLARDRFGEKPLYLHEANGALYFASEVKALLRLPAVPREVDLSAVWDYLAYRYVPGPRTLLQAVRKLPPATAAIWHRGHLQEIRYWTPPDKFPRTKKMVLTGEGSDEILGGYRKHAAECLAWMYWSVPRPVRALLAPLVQQLPFRFRDLKIAMASLNCQDWRERYVRWFGAMDFQQRRELSRLRVHEHELRDDLPPFDAHPDTSALRRVLYFDQTSWLPDNLLERGDRMTMAASIEARVPFLDHKLAEFASTLPDTLRVDELRRKRVLREAAKALLPRQVLKRPKIGFRVPV